MSNLLHNIILFARLLRQVGIEVTPSQIVDLVDALAYVDLSVRADVKNTARAILISEADHQALFEIAFDEFWRVVQSENLAKMDVGRPISRPPEPEEMQVQEHEAGDSGQSDQVLEEMQETVYTYSAVEVLRQKDFELLSEDELGEVQRLMQRLQWQLELRRTRRKTRDSRGQYLDLRRTLRYNLRHGGEPLKLSWQGRKFKRRPVVIIADISGSMERYSRVLLKFVYVISSGLGRVESFVFGTRLTRVTNQLKHRKIDVALDDAVHQVQDWGGGTRIGDSLKTFNFEWARRVLGQGAVVMIISDGWDRGDVELLDQEMQRLKLSCHRLVWLNPLLGLANYEPLTRGIVTALPHIDHFLPVHNLVSLEQLGALLEDLTAHKPR